ncbi:hypothetical protein BC834DRAFT_158545 [Gloeopeniophorella convolvens]|nr:hypothetical protein BC834DRAFT_158545 [Gloeopeniophorella convolvens]
MTRITNPGYRRCEQRTWISAPHIHPDPHYATYSRTLDIANVGQLFPSHCHCVDTRADAQRRVLELKRLQSNARFLNARSDTQCHHPSRRRTSRIVYLRTILFPSTKADGCGPAARASGTPQRRNGHCQSDHACGASACRPSYDSQCASVPSGNTARSGPESCSAQPCHGWACCAPDRHPSTGAGQPESPPEAS